ncbi:MAG TPA: hypothetical protein VIY73_26105 [Polyangiaceae bacterium]
MNLALRFPRLLAAGVLAASLAVPCAARAQSSPQDQAVAQSLYDEAKKLMAAGKWSDACPKLEESQRLDPAPVTEFYLADCYERAGRTASAWTTFLDLAAKEHATGGAKSAEREKVARDRAKALEPKLSQLAVDVPAAARVPGLVVKRDGEAVRDGQWGAPVAVDPGKHTVEASAPGKKAWSATQDVQGAGTTTTVHVEALPDAPVEAPPAAVAATAPATSLPSTPPADMPSGPSPLRTVGLVVGGVGVAGLAVGTVFGVIALSKNSAANSGNCGGSLGGANDCNQTGVNDRSSAVTAGNVSTVALIAGGVLAAGGATLFLVAPSSHVQVGATAGGVLLRGDF